MSDQIRQCDAGHLSLGSGTWECPWCKVAKAEAEVARLRAFAHRLLIVHEMRDEKTADAILDAALRGEGEK